jgi:hypothetical protein
VTAKAVLFANNKNDTNKRLIFRIQAKLNFQTAALAAIFFFNSHPPQKPPRCSFGYAGGFFDSDISSKKISLNFAAKLFLQLALIILFEFSQYYI